MVEIETLLRGADGQFRRVEDCRITPPDLDYIEGAIRLSIDGVDILSLEEWDYVDQLWCYIAQMVARLRSVGRVETFFPDQPIKLSFELTGSRILVSAEIGEEVRRASTSSVEFFAAIRSAGIIFFDKMTELAPEISYAEARVDLLT